MEISKDINLPVNELDDLIKRILTPTHKSTIKDLNEWIDENVPLLPELKIIIHDNDEDPFDESTMEELNDWFYKDTSLHPNIENSLLSNGDELNIEEALKKHTSEEIEEIEEDNYSSNIVFYIPTQLREDLKANLVSSNLKDGRFYRIRFGIFLDLDHVRPMNEDDKSPSYQFMERMIDFAYNRTLHHLERNYKKSCPNKEIREYLQKSLIVICKKK